MNVQSIIRLLVVLWLSALIPSAQANFAIFQVAGISTAPPTADAVCDFTTGLYAGFGGAT